MNQQLVLNLPHRPALERQDFLVADSNAEAIAVLDAWPNWTDCVQAITGPKACGKSHLAAVWVMMSAAHYYDIGQLQNENLADLMDHKALVLDNLECLTPECEQALFHLINNARENGHSLLLCSRLPLEKVAVSMPDLSSRLKAIIYARMFAPCDILMSAILSKLFADRQLMVSKKVMNYMLPRLERSFFALNQIVAKIDEITLKQKRPITIPLVSDILTSLEHEKEDEKDEAHVG